MADPLVVKYASALADWKSDYFMAPSQDLRALVKRITDLESEVEFAWSDENDPLAEETKTLRAKLTKLEAERDEWRTSASMACESPPPGCDCAGCRFAEQYRAEETAKAELEKVRGENKSSHFDAD